VLFSDKPVFAFLISNVAFVFFGVAIDVLRDYVTEILAGLFVI